MRVYLAGPWARKEEVKAGREVLLEAGFEVTSRWIDTPDFNQNDAELMQGEAQKDLDDIFSSEAVVVMNLEKSEGKAVEQGIAYSNNIPVVVVGKPLNVFQYLPTGFTRVGTLNEAVEVLNARV